MNVVQVAIHQIVHVIAVRYRFVPATLSMDMPSLMTAALVPARAICRILSRYRQDVLVNVPFMWMMQMPVMQIVDVPFVLNRNVPAPGPMNMRMIFVYVMFHIYFFPFITFF